MKTFYDCLSCFVAQAVSVLERCQVDHRTFQQTMRSVFAVLTEVDFTAPPPATVWRLNTVIRQAVGLADPYAAEKRNSNRLALAVARRLFQRLSGPADGYLPRLRLAIAANSIDYARYGDLDETAAFGSLETALDAPIDVAAADRLLEAVHQARDILYLCDNAGEIVFDRFLIEFLPHNHLTAVVRGAPVINDATLDDAKQVGLTDLVPVIDNGFDAPGTILDRCAPAFVERFKAADLIIAKGQGNFETLSDVSGKRVFFLLKVKCPVIARDIGLPTGRLVVREHWKPDE